VENTPKTFSVTEQQAAVKELAAKWKSLDEVKRAEYEKRSAYNRELYVTEMEKWKKEVSGKDEAKTLEQAKERLNKLRQLKRQLNKDWLNAIEKSENVRGMY